VSGHILLKRFPRSEVKGQGHTVQMCKCYKTTEAYISTVWRRGTCFGLGPCIIYAYIN